MTLRAATGVGQFAPIASPTFTGVLQAPQIYQTSRNAYTNFTGGAPSASANSSSIKMMGFGGLWILTPTFSGRIKFDLRGYITGDTATANTTYNCYYGTGTAPANRDAETGTKLNNSGTLITTAIAGSPAAQFAFYGEATGLTLNTALWFDMGISASSGTATCAYKSLVIEEF